MKYYLRAEKFLNFSLKVQEIKSELEKNYTLFELFKFLKILNIPYYKIYYDFISYEKVIDSFLPNIKKSNKLICYEESIDNLDIIFMEKGESPYENITRFKERTNNPICGFVIKNKNFAN